MMRVWDVYVKIDDMYSIWLEYTFFFSPSSFSSSSSSPSPPPSPSLYLLTSVFPPPFIFFPFFPLLFSSSSPCFPSSPGSVLLRTKNDCRIGILLAGWLGSEVLCLVSEIDKFGKWEVGSGKWEVGVGVGGIEGRMNTHTSHEKKQHGKKNQNQINRCLTIININPINHYFPPSPPL